MNWYTLRLYSAGSNVVESAELIAWTSIFVLFSSYSTSKCSDREESITKATLLSPTHPELVPILPVETFSPMQRPNFLLKRYPRRVSYQYDSSFFSLQEVKFQRVSYWKIPVLMLPHCHFHLIDFTSKLLILLWQLSISSFTASMGSNKKRLQNIECSWRRPKSSVSLKSTILELINNV